MKAHRQTLVQAKQDWAHQQLHHATEVKDIWALAWTRKGQQVNTYPPLKAADGTLIDTPALKTEVLRQHFFPHNPVQVATRQDGDPNPLPTCQWPPISKDEVTATLSMAADSSALGPSGMGYWLLKWAHTTHPNILTIIFNLSLDLGTHLWCDTMVVVLNKPNCPDYSLAKAYRPISLLECAGKLMEKIVAKRVNIDISTNTLLPMTQFGSRPYHNTINAIATLVHQI